MWHLVLPCVGTRMDNSMSESVNDEICALMMSFPHPPSYSKAFLTSLISTGTQVLRTLTYLMEILSIEVRFR
jgi:hypothetical protein